MNTTLTNTVLFVFTSLFLSFCPSDWSEWGDSSILLQLSCRRMQEQDVCVFWSEWSQNHQQPLPVWVQGPHVRTHSSCVRDLPQSLILSSPVLHGNKLYSLFSGGHGSQPNTYCGAPHHLPKDVTATQWLPLTVTCMCLAVRPTTPCPTSCTATTWTLRAGRWSIPAWTVR